MSNFKLPLKYRWIAFFVIMLCIGVAISIALNYLSFNYKKENLILEGQAILDGCAERIENISKTNKNIVSKFEVNEHIDTVLKSEQTEMSSSIISQELTKLGADLNNRVLADSINRCYLYIECKDIFVAPNMFSGMKHFFEINYKGTNITFEEWRAFLKNSAFGDCLVVDNEKKRFIEFIYTIPGYYAKGQMVYMVISIDMDYIYTAKSEDIVNVLLLNEYNKNIIGDLDEKIEISDGLKIEGSAYEDDGDFLLKRDINSEQNWTIVGVISEKTIRKEMIFLLLYGIILIILQILCIVFLSKKFIKQNYIPIENMLIECGADKKNFLGNEFKIINSAIINGKVLNQSITEYKRKNSILDKRWLFSKLLLERHGASDFEMADERTFKYKNFIVLIIELCEDESKENCFDFEDENDYSTALYAVENVMEELLNDRLSAIGCDVEGQLLMIVNFESERRSEVFEIIKDIIENVRYFVLENFGFQFHACMSGVHNSINNAYEEVSELYENNMSLFPNVYFYANDGVCVDDADEFDTQLKEVISYLEQNYKDKNINVAMVGDVFSVSPYYLSKKFKTTLGIGIMEYITAKRIDEAKSLILGTKNSVEKISEAVGFNSLNTFNRAFLKSEGITPGRFRAKYLNLE